MVLLIETPQLILMIGLTNYSIIDSSVCFNGSRWVCTVSQAITGRLGGFMG